MKKTIITMALVFSVLANLSGSAIACDRDYLRVTCKLDMFDAPYGKAERTLYANTILRYAPMNPGEGGMGWVKVSVSGTDRVGWVNVNNTDDVEIVCPDPGRNSDSHL